MLKGGKSGKLSDEYEVLEEIGKGTYSTCKRCICRATKETILTCTFLKWPNTESKFRGRLLRNRMSLHLIYNLINESNKCEIFSLFILTKSILLALYNCEVSRKYLVQLLISLTKACSQFLR